MMLSPKYNPPNGWRDICSWLKTFFGIIAAVLSIYALSPSVTVEAGANLDNKNPFATVFKVTNNGLLPVNNIDVQCEILTGPQSVGPTLDVKVINRHPSSSPWLYRGHSMTVGCNVISGLKEMVRIDVRVHYQWPIIGWPWNESVSHFVTVQDKNTGGYVLVPFDGE